MKYQCGLIQYYFMGFIVHGQRVSFLNHLVMPQKQLRKKFIFLFDPPEYILMAQGLVPGTFDNKGNNLFSSLKNMMQIYPRRSQPYEYLTLCYS